MSAPIRYAEPRQVDRLEDCFFYHRVDIPGVGTVGEQWDLRGAIDDYLGRFDVRGKRVLDVGTAGGFLTFALEQRGAEVVSFDMADGAQWNLVPHVSLQPRLPQMLLDHRAIDQKLKNAYWFTHRRLGSKAKAFYGDIYDLPAELGPFDMAFFGMILTHLRDPFQALYSVSRLVKSHMLITNQMNTENPLPMARFVPSPENLNTMSWWIPTEQCLRQMLAILGFDVKRVVESRPDCLVSDRQGPVRCVCLVSDRVAGEVCVPKPAVPHAA